MKDHLLTAISGADRTGEFALPDIERVRVLHFPDDIAGQPGFAGARQPDKKRETAPMRVHLGGKLAGFGERGHTFGRGRVECVETRFVKLGRAKGVGAEAGWAMQKGFKGI